MIVKGQALEQLLRGPGKMVRAVMFYGPNAGRVQEYAERITRSVVEDLSDPFRIAHLTAAALSIDMTRLADEAAAIAMTGGRRVVRVRGVGDGLTEAFENCLENSQGDSLVVVEAGDLGKTSRLRKLFENSAICAVGACYEESDAELETLVISHLRQYGLSITSEAKDYLLNSLGEDRLITRQELEKLVLYKGPSHSTFNSQPRDNKAQDSHGVSALHGSKDIADIYDIRDICDIAGGRDVLDLIGAASGKRRKDGKDSKDAVGGKYTGGVRDTNDIHSSEDSSGMLDVKDDSKGRQENQGVSVGNYVSDTVVELADVIACIGDNSTQDLDAICDAMALGDMVALDRQIQRAYDAAVSTIIILRAASSHILRIQMAVASVEKGESSEIALRSLRPPIHFSRIPLVQRQLRLWNLVRAARALDLLLDAEAACKTTGARDLSLCRHALSQVALLIRPTS